MGFNFIDKITTFESQKLAKGIKIISSSEKPYFANENKLYPMMLIEAIGQLNAWITMEMNNFQVRPIAILYGELNLYDTAELGDQLIIETELKRFDEGTSLFDGRVMLNDKILVEVIDAAGSFLDIENFAFPDVYQTMFENLKMASSVKTLAKPIEQMDRLFDYDHVEQIEDNKIIATKHISGSYGFFKDHFPKKPILPISILLQNNVELGKLMLEKKGLAVNKIKHIQLNNIKMRDFISPGSLLTTSIELLDQGANQITCKIDNTVNDKIVCRGTMNYYVS
jgi:3-hydroxymyristoyl/3-hydroxydecanoyl-(acyl carrier protein) dehydratase